MASGTPRPLQATPQKLRIPRTPLESRQGYHPKKVRFYTRIYTRATAQPRPAPPLSFNELAKKSKMVAIH